MSVDLPVLSLHHNVEEAVFLVADLVELRDDLRCDDRQAAIFQEAFLGVHDDECLLGLQAH